MSKPPRLTKGYKANFDTLKRAVANGDLALVSALRKDGTPVALICAMQPNHKDNTIMPVPLAEMVMGNPFELYQDPTQV